MEGRKARVLENSFRIHPMTDAFIPSTSHIKKWPGNTVPFLSKNVWGDLTEPNYVFPTTSCCDVPPVCSNEACCNWQNLRECVPHAHGLNVRCRNMQFQSGLPSPLNLYRVRVGDHVQYGLVATQEIKAGTLIAEYTGIIRLEHEVNVQSNCFWMHLDADAYVDASTCGSLARFVNHCCVPNSEFQSWMVPISGLEIVYSPRVGLFALRDIKVNEVVTADYRLLSELPRSMPCLCGRPECAGFVDQKRWKARDAPVLPSAWTEPVAAFDIPSDFNPAAVSRGMGGSDIPDEATIINSASTDVVRTHLNCRESMSVFQKYGLNFLQISKDVTDIATEFVKYTNRFGKNQVITTYHEEQTKCGKWEVHVLAYGVLFIGFGKKKVKARRDAILQCLECFQSGAKLNPGYKAFLLEPSVAIPISMDSMSSSDLNVEDFLIMAHRKLRHYYSKLMKHADKPEHVRDVKMQQASARLCGTIHLYAKSPMSVLRYLQVDPAMIHKGLPLSGPPSTCLARRNKLLEFGSRHRLQHFDKGFLIFNTTFGPCLVKTSPSQTFSRLETALRMHGATLHNVVDWQQWKNEKKSELTVAALMKDYATKETEKGPKLITRVNTIWVSRIQQVLFPLQSVCEVEALVELIERRAGPHLSALYHERLRTVKVEDPTVNPDVTVTIGAREEALSSMICAQQMQLSEMQYLKDKAEAVRIVRECGTMVSAGFHNDDVPELEWQTLRTIYERWTHVVNLSGLQGAHRIIQGGVDEWLMVGSNKEVNDAFYNAIGGTSLTCQLSEMPQHDKGLSAVALAPNGQCFIRGEYWQILIGEALTNDLIKNIISALKMFLVTYQDQPMQSTHGDDLRKGAISHTRSLNYENDCPGGYEGTYVNTLPTSFDHDSSELYNKAIGMLENGASVEQIVTECGVAGQQLDDCYRQTSTLLPIQIEEVMRPVFRSFKGGHGFFAKGSTLHAGPGTIGVKGAKFPRVICLTFSSVGWDLYSGVHQTFLNLLHESFYGTASFMCMAHVAHYALVHGVHIGDHYLEQKLVPNAIWKTSKHGNPWSKGQFFTTFVECCIRVMLPDFASDMENGVKHVPGYLLNSRKRGSDGNLRPERYKHFFDIEDVSDSMIVVWEFINMKQGVREARISTRLSTAKSSIKFESWAASAIFKQLARAYRVFIGVLDLECEVPGWEDELKRGHGYASFSNLYRGKLNRKRARGIYDACRLQAPSVDSCTAEEV